MYHNAASAHGSVAYSPLEVNSLLLFLCIALIGGLICFKTRTRIKTVLGPFLRVRPAESSPRMRVSAQSVEIEPTTDLSYGPSQYSTGLLSQPSNGLRHRNQADHTFVERLGSEYQTNLRPWQERTTDAGDAELRETTAGAGDAEWQGSAADAGDAELRETTAGAGDAEWQESAADPGEVEWLETTADSGDAEWQEKATDADEAEWQKINLLSLGHPAYLS